MKVNSLLLALLLTSSVHAAAEGPETAAVPDGLTQALIQKEYARIAPSICLLSYSIEVTNPNSGQVSQREASTLGVIVSSDGLVLAHGHMQLDNRQPENIRATVDLLGERKEYPALMLKKPDDVNVCFLQLQPDPGGPAPKFPALSFSAGNELAMAEPVLVLGLLAESLDNVPSAIVRRVGAVLSEPRTTYTLDEIVPFGFVGGPVVDRSGSVVGVVGFDLSENEGGELYTRSGHPLVYQASLFDDYISRPPREDTLDRDREDAWLGVFTQPLTDDLAEYWNLPAEGGVVVSTVVPESPAAAAGLIMGDVIVAFNGQPVRAKQDRDVSGFTRMVRETPLNVPVPLKVYRDGQLLDLALTLTIRPKSASDAQEHEEKVLGLTVRELTTDVRLLLNLADDVQGVIIRKVESGTPANLAGVPVNAIVMAINNIPITGVDDYIAAIDALSTDKPAEVAVLCRVGARTGFFRLQPRWEN